MRSAVPDVPKARRSVYQSESLYEKLRPGPGHAPADVRANQRARLRNATIDLVAEHGYPGLTVRALSRTSGVSTRTFYAHFANAEECFASTYRSIMRRAAAQLSDYAPASWDREEALRTRVRALTNLVVESPRAAKLALVDCYDGGPAMLREVEIATAGLERQLAAAPAGPPLPVSQAVVAGVERVLRTKLLEDCQDELPRLAVGLADWVVGVHGLEPDPAAGATSRPTERRLLLPVPGRKDPGFAVFEAIGGDRGRILAAVARLSLANGYWNLRPPDIRREAGVTRRKFDALFGSIDGCYLEASEALTASAARLALEDAGTASTRQARIERIGNHFCEELARSPLLAQFGFLDIFAPGSEGLLCREHLLTAARKRLRGSVPRDRRRGDVALDASIAASWRVVQAELVTKGIGAPMEAPFLIARLILAESRREPTTR